MSGLFQPRPGRQGFSTPKFRESYNPDADRTAMATGNVFPKPQVEDVPQQTITPSGRSSNFSGLSTDRRPFGIISSPLNFQTDSPGSPTDIDENYLIFHPAGSTMASPLSPESVSSIDSVFAEYSRFREQNPESLTTNEFYSKLNWRWNFRFPDVQFDVKFSPAPLAEFSQQLEQQLENINQQIANYEEKFNYQPPPLFIALHENLTKNPMDNQRIFQIINNGIMQYANQNIIDVLEQIHLIKQNSTLYFSAIRKLATASTAAKRYFESMVVKTQRFREVQDRTERARITTEQYIKEREKFYYLWEMLSFKPTKITGSEATVTNYQSKLSVRCFDASQPHSSTAQLARNNNFSREIIEIGRFIPYLRQENGCVYGTFADKRKRFRFEVEFHLHKGYPWSNIQGKITNVTIGNPEAIAVNVTRICDEISHHQKQKYPLLAICRSIYEGINV